MSIPKWAFVSAKFWHSVRQWGAAVPAIAASGMFAPVGPRALVAMARSFRQFGPTPALLLATTAIRYPDRVAVIDESGQITYRELQEHAESVAAALFALSPTAPRSVGIVCRNHRGFVESMCAGAQLGAEVIFINTELPPGQLQAILHRHNPDVLVYDDEYAATVEDSQYRGLRVLAWCEPGTVSGQLPTLSELAAQRHPAPPPVRRPVKLTLLTSGTTGLAKGVPRAVKPRAVALLCATALATVRLRSSDTVLVAPPFFHGFGLLTLLGPLALGGTVVCRRQIDARQALDDIDRLGVSVLIAVPVMLERLLALLDRDPQQRRSSLRLAVTGAAPISPTTISAFIAALGPILVNGYGSTEAGLVTIATPADLAAAPNTVGRTALGVSVRILRADRTVAPTGQAGTIFVRTVLDYTGYTPDKTARPTNKRIVDAHVDTGDIGHFDSQGRLYIDGRSDDMIVSGGENVFPGEVEDRLVTHSALADAVVIGVPDTEFGQVLHAFVVAVPGSEVPTEDQLKELIRGSLERYKVPKRFTVLNEIPRNASGKVLRSQLYSHDTH
jgi:acyl-CoA synthetase (AMP-forming)/AMP-acid ligase II